MSGGCSGTGSASPVTAILGPRLWGKTTLAREVARQREAVSFDLEDPADRVKLGTQKSHQIQRLHDRLPWSLIVGELEELAVRLHRNRCHWIVVMDGAAFQQGARRRRDRFIRSRLWEGPLQWDVVELRAADLARGAELVRELFGRRGA